MDLTKELAAQEIGALLEEKRGYVARKEAAEQELAEAEGSVAKEAAQAKVDAMSHRIGQVDEQLKLRGDAGSPPSKRSSKRGK